MKDSLNDNKLIKKDKINIIDLKELNDYKYNFIVNDSFKPSGEMSISDIYKNKISSKIISSVENDFKSNSEINNKNLTSNSNTVRNNSLNMNMNSHFSNIDSYNSNIINKKISPNNNNNSNDREIKNNFTFNENNNDVNLINDDIYNSNNNNSNSNNVHKITETTINNIENEDNVINKNINNKYTKKNKKKKLEPLAIRPLINSATYNFKPKITFITQPSLLKLTENKNKYNLPKSMPYHKYTLDCSECDFEPSELLDKVDDINLSDIKLNNKIKYYFHYGEHIYKYNFEINYLVQSFLKQFYKKLENKINFTYDIYNLPKIKNNLFFKRPNTNKENRYKATINKLKDILYKIPSNLLNNNVLFRLNRLKRLKIIVKDYQSLHEVKDNNDSFDFSEYSYLTNKYLRYKHNTFATLQQKKAIYSFDNYYTNKETNTICHKHISSGNSIFGLNRPFSCSDIVDNINNHVFFHTFNQHVKNISTKKLKQIADKITIYRKKEKAEFEDLLNSGYDLQSFIIE